MHVIQVDNLYCIMLPPNATSLIQPLDQGIIAMVKARYRKWYLRWTLKQDNRANALVTPEQQTPSDDDEANDDEVVPVRDAEAPLHTLKPSIRRGIRKLTKIWNEVEPVHIFNCWRKSDIIPQGWRNLYDVPAVALLQQEYEELGSLIPLVHPDGHFRMNALEYVHDVVGENEREALVPEEDITPAQSTDSPSGGISVSDNGSPGSLAVQYRSPRPPRSPTSPAEVGSTGGSPPHHTSQDGDSQESRALLFGSPAFSFSDSIQCAQLPLDDPALDWDLNL